MEERAETGPGAGALLPGVPDGSGASGASGESGLAVRAAWLYYVYGLKQAEVAQHLGLSRVKVHRLLALAHAQGSVKVFVEGGAAACIALEQRLRAAYGLDHARVVPSAGEGPDAAGDPVIRSLGVAGAQFLHQHLENNPQVRVGVGHGRTLAAVAEALPRLARPQASFVSILGSLTRRSTANPFDVIARLAERSGGAGYFVPAPFFVDSVGDARIMLGQRVVRDVLARARTSDLVVLSIGNLFNSPAIYEAERRALAKLGVVAEVLGQFLDARGQEVDCDMARRSISLRLHELHGRAVVAVAGGLEKAAAIRATLASGLLKGLLIDEATAQAVLDAPAAAPRARARAAKPRR